MSVKVYTEQTLWEQRYPKQTVSRKMSRDELEKNEFYKQGWNDAIQTIIEGMPKENGDILVDALKREVGAMEA